MIVSGERGIGGAEGFQQLAELARILKGAMGASRPPCDNKWVPDSLQIGLTGKIVSPEVYIAVALSGSSQPLSGCSGAKTIVAINKDPESKILKWPIRHCGTGSKHSGLYCKCKDLMGENKKAQPAAAFFKAINYSFRAFFPPALSVSPRCSSGRHGSTFIVTALVGVAPSPLSYRFQSIATAALRQGTSAQ